MCNFGSVGAMGHPLNTTPSTPPQAGQQTPTQTATSQVATRVLGSMPSPQQRGSHMIPAAVISQSPTQNSQR